MAIIYDLNKVIMGFSEALDHVDEIVNKHQLRTAYIALIYGEAARFKQKDMERLFLLSLHHDIGAIFAEERKGLIEFENIDPEPHCQLGADVLRRYERIGDCAEVIRYHHTSIQDYYELTEYDQIREIVMLADRMERLIRLSPSNLKNVHDIRSFMDQEGPTWFSEWLINLFESVDLLRLLSGAPLGRITNLLQETSPVKDICIGSRELERYLSMYKDMVQMRFLKTRQTTISPFFEMIGQAMRVDSEMLAFYVMCTNLYDLSVPLYANATTYDTMLVGNELGTNMLDIMNVASSFVITSDYPLLSYHHNIGYKIMTACQVFLMLWSHAPASTEGSKWVKEELVAQSKKGLIDHMVMKVMMERYDSIDQKLFELKKESRNKIINFNR